MATLSELQRAYNNPNVRKMLDLIASAEGVKHGYNTLFGNQQFSDLSQHPNVRKQFKQTDGHTNFTTAAGRYQFIKDTWASLKQQYGFKDFSPQSQDLGAIALMAGRGALDDVMMGRFGKAIGKLGKEWASLPSSGYAQPKRSWGEVNKLLGSSSRASKIDDRPQAREWSELVGQERPQALNWTDLTGQQKEVNLATRPPAMQWSDLAGGG